MQIAKKLDQNYNGIESWTYRNLVSDFSECSELVAKIERGFQREHIFYHNDCTVTLRYGSKTLSVEARGKGENITKLQNTIENKINQYNKEYCNNTGIVLFEDTLSTNYRKK